MAAAEAEADRVDTRQSVAKRVRRSARPRVSTTLEELRVSLSRQAGIGLGAAQDARRMTPEERKEQGPKIQALREEVAGALAARKQTLENAALEAAA